MARNSLTLAWRLQSLNLLILFLACMGVAFFVAQEALSTREKALEAEGIALLKVAVEQAEVGLVQNRPSHLQNMVDLFLKMDGPAYVGVVLENGDALAEKGHLPVAGLPAFNPSSGDAPTIQVFANSVDDISYIQLVQAVLNPNGRAEAPLGFVRLCLSKEPLRAQHQSFLVYSFLLALGVVLVAGLVLFRLTRNVISPLKQVVDAMPEIAKGKLEHDIVADGEDEVSVIVRGFNDILTRLRDSRKEVVNYQLTLEDRVKTRTNELIQAKVEAETAHNTSRAKSEFLANMSHEFRNPLNHAQRLCSQLAAGDLSFQERDLVERLSDEVQQLQGMLEDIEDFSKVDEESLALDVIDFDPRHILEEVHAVLIQKAKVKGVELRTQVQKNVPELVGGDPGRLRQVLMHLLNNAVRTAKPGEMLVLVKLNNLDEKRCSIRFEAHQSHHAMSRQLQDEILKGYAGGHDPSEEHADSGLGLSVARQLVDLMRGSIGVQSKPGEGTTFYFSAEFEVRESRRSLDQLNTRDFEGLRVLVVDPGVNSRELLIAQMANWGMTCAARETGREALEVLEEARASNRPFDLLIVEMIMSGMDGIELAQMVASNPDYSKVRIMMLTSANHHVNTRKARMLGVNSTAIKPINQEKLYEALQRLIKEPLLSDSPNGSDNSKSPIPQFDARVLVSEDNGVNQAVAESMLENLGCRIVLASNGREAVDIVSRTQCDLILMDIQMPVMDGLTAMRMIREQERDAETPRHTPIVAVTAHAVPGDRENYLALGMDDYLSKPFDLEQLTALLNRWLTPREARLMPTPVPGLSSVKGNNRQEGSGVIDVSVLDKIRAMETDRTPNIVDKLIEMFQEDTPKIIHAVHEAVASGDPASARRALHTLKSSSANLGGKGLSDLCARMEHMAKDKDMDKLAETLIDLQCEYDQVLKALDLERRRHEPA